MGKVGKVSIEFENMPYIREYASVVGQKEGEGPLAKYFDKVIEDKVNDVIDILLNYPGDIQVIMAIGGKKFNSNCSVRWCEGLKTELSTYFQEKDIIIFKKKV